MKKIRIAAAAVFIMTALFVLPVIVKAASVGETVSQSTAAELKAIDYATDAQIANLLKPYDAQEMFFEESFAEVQTEIEEIIQGVINNAERFDGKKRMFMSVRYKEIKKNCCWAVHILTDCMISTWENII